VILLGREAGVSRIERKTPVCIIGNDFGGGSGGTRMGLLPFCMEGSEREKLLRKGKRDIQNGGGTTAVDMGQH